MGPNRKSRLKSYLTTGVRSALRGLWQELTLQRWHKASMKRARRLGDQRGLKLNLGCGAKHKAGWVNIDLREDADLQLDMRERFPFSDESVSTIYSEHFVEHLEYPAEVAHLLSESLRVLEPGGVFSVGVPDAEETLLRYASGELPALIEQWSKDERLQWFPPWVWTTPMHLVNFSFRQGREHKYAYDFGTLARVLTDAGLINVRRREFDPGIDSADRRDGTLYVDGCKPKNDGPRSLPSITYRRRSEGPS